MEQITKQILSLWKKCSGLQKALITFFIVFTIALLCFVFVSQPKQKFSLLYSSNELKGTSSDEVVKKLKEHGIAAHEKDGALFVKQAEWESAKTLLGAKKENSGKGYALFDTGTWIKGEKELQILEMRALTYELENDLASFDAVDSAHVVLDIAKERSLLSKNVQKTKASVILNLKKGQKLTKSTLAAITFHLSSAVHGLEPANVAISDTTGRLYQGFGHETTAVEMQEIYLEEKIKNECTLFLQKIMKGDPFHIAVGAESGKVVLAIILDEKYRSEQISLTKLLKTIISSAEVRIEFATLLPKPHLKETKSTFNKNWFYVLSIFALFPLLFLKRKQKRKEMRSPKEIAILLSQLDIQKAEEIINELPTDLQRSVFAELSSMESS